jgi:hypothetical protein
MEREPPVGCSDSEINFDSFEMGEIDKEDKFRILEDERDTLQKSMISLTSRLAQVQFYNQHFGLRVQFL